MNNAKMNKQTYTVKIGVNIHDYRQDHCLTISQMALILLSYFVPFCMKAFSRERNCAVTYNIITKNNGRNDLYANALSSFAHDEACNEVTSKKTVRTEAP